MLIYPLIDFSVQKTYRPLVKRLGFEYPTGEDPSTTKLRTEAITTAAIRGDEEWVILQVHLQTASLTSYEGSSKSSNLASTISLTPETIQGSRQTWRPSPTGSRSCMGAGKSGSLSKGSMRPGRPPLHASLQCEHDNMSRDLDLLMPSFFLKAALLVKARMLKLEMRLWSTCGRKLKTRTSFTSSLVSQATPRRRGCSGLTCLKITIRYGTNCWAIGDNLLLTVPCGLRSRRGLPETRCTRT